MRILLIGNGNSIWIKTYIQNVLVGKNIEVLLLSDSKVDKYDDYYIDEGIKIINYNRSIPIIRNIPIFRSLINIVLAIITLKQYYFEAIHIHFVNKYACIISYFLRKNTKKIIYTYWGSDLLRRSNKQLRSYRRFINSADIITMSSRNLKDVFNKVYGYKYDYKIKKTLFGISVFDYIDRINITETHSSIRSFFNIPDDKLVVTIGYNASVMQQHEKILEKILCIPYIILQRIYILVPMTYGHYEAEYLEKIKLLLSKTKCDSKILLNYMDFNDIARLRITTDIFIHAQVSDSFSATFSEHIYAGGVVINGSWNRYEDLIENGVKYEEFTNFDELPDLLIKTICNIEEYKTLSETIKNNIKRLESWEAVADKWYELYC